MSDFDEMVIACVAIDPTQYSALRYALWRRSKEQMREEGREMPSIHPGSVQANCLKCGIAVAVGPRQQEILVEAADADKAVLITCLLCATLLMVDPNSEVQLSAAEDWEGRL